MTEPMPARFDYDWAYLRVVPRVHLGTFVNVGVVLHARTARFLGLRYALDPAFVAPLCPETLTPADLERHLDAYARLARGGADLGEIGALPPSERFHWLTAPRSAVVQTSELRTGQTTDPAACLDHLFDTLSARALVPGR